VEADWGLVPAAVAGAQVEAAPQAGAAARAELEVFGKPANRARHPAAAQVVLAAVGQVAAVPGAVEEMEVAEVAAPGVAVDPEVAVAEAELVVEAALAEAELVVEVALAEAELVVEAALAVA
jgi:hypothetical protein